MKPTVKRTVGVSITSSGYDDRYIVTSPIYTISKKGHDVTTTGDKWNVADTLEAIFKIDYDEAVGMVEGAPTVYSIEGWHKSMGPLAWSRHNITQDELRAISAYLDIYTQKLNAEAQQRQLAFLLEHPLSDKIRGIVEYRLKEILVLRELRNSL